ncbi:ribonuclease H-like domain-containing protein [Tanacetum coccineum]
MTMRTKPDVDTLSIDELYNNLKVFEQELTSTSKSSATAQNVAFVSHSKSNTNKVKSSHTGAYSTYTRTSSNNIQEREVPVGFADEKLECFKCHNTGHFARECPSNGTNDGKKRDSFYQDQGAGKKVADQNLFTKTNSFKGVPHPLTGDYTSKPQEEIDDSLYVYGKKGPQKPEISDSDDNSTEPYLPVNQMTVQDLPVQLNTGRVNVNSVRHNVNSVRTNVNTGRSKQPIPTCNSNSFSPVRPQQNEVAERMNRTLIEAARTMLADSLLPTTFWAEAVVLLAISSIGVLGKFDGKSDEGFLVGYSLNSKAYRWMFDIDYLTDSMNYISVSLENQAKPHAGTSTVTNHACTSEVTNNAGTPNTNASEEEDEAEELIIVPIAVQHTAAKYHNIHLEILAFRRDLDDLAQKHLQEVPKNKAISTNLVNSGSGIDDGTTCRIKMNHDTSLALTRKSWCDEFEALMKEHAKKYDLASVKTAITPMETKMALTKEYMDRGRSRGVGAGLGLVEFVGGHDENQGPTSTYAEATRINVADLLHLVPQLVTRIDNLEKELKENKQTTTVVIVKLVKKVKNLETRVKYGNLPNRKMVISDSESEDAANSSKHGRNLGEEDVFETPKGKDSREADISPSGLQAAETLVQGLLKRLRLQHEDVKVQQRKEKELLEETNLSLKYQRNRLETRKSQLSRNCKNPAQEAVETERKPQNFKD